jgi:hypothetical protein
LRSPRHYRPVRRQTVVALIQIIGSGHDVVALPHNPAGNKPLHHLRMPRECEEENENKKTNADQDLDKTEDGDEPVEKASGLRRLNRTSADRVGSLVEQVPISSINPARRATTPSSSEEIAGLFCGRGMC